MITGALPTWPHPAAAISRDCARQTLEACAKLAEGGAGQLEHHRGLEWSRKGLGLFGLLVGGGVRPLEFHVL